MKALVYHGPGRKAWEEVPDAAIKDDSDAVVQVDTATICGTDLHILKGDTPEVSEGSEVIGPKPAITRRLGIACATPHPHAVTTAAAI